MAASIYQINTLRTIPSVSTDVSKVGHGVTKTRVASSSLNRPHKLKITLQSLDDIKFNNRTNRIISN